MKVKVKFFPRQQEVEVPWGSNLLQVASEVGIPVESNCGGKGSCGKCKVKIISGRITDPTPVELRTLSSRELEMGWRLACQQQVQGELLVETITHKEDNLRKTKLHWTASVFVPEPYIEKKLVIMEPPEIQDQRADWERLLDSIPEAGSQIHRLVLTRLPGLLRRAKFRVTVVLADGEIIAVEEGDTTQRKFGLAFDIGTTTVLGMLVDLNHGSIIASYAATNPQNIFGADVISRITYAATEPQGLEQLHAKVLDVVNEITRLLLEQTGVNQNEVYEAVVVGNTTMSHLFLGVDPSNLASAPFIPAYSSPVEVRAGELGLLMHPLSRVYVLPNIAGYVGSDTVGMMLATRLEEKEGFCLAVDIGTNGEVVLSGQGKILTCSTAAGPAFEGAQIQNGMRAVEGAVEGVRIAGGEVFLDIIGASRPRGICGSGLIDAVAELLSAGVIDFKGKFREPDENLYPMHPQLKRRLRKGRIGYEFILVPADRSATGEDIVITQKDIRELQLAKGAIFAGIQVLLKEMGISMGEVSKVFLAGAFGNYIKKENALRIGLFPDISLERIVPVGNAAGDGAMVALISRKERTRAVSLARQARYVELSTSDEFQKRFIQAVNFPILREISGSANDT